MKERTYKNLITVFLLILISIVLINQLGLEYQAKETSQISRYYIDNHERTGSDNIVEAILMDYRVYDTFGEVMVLYIAISGVMILGRKKEDD